MARIQYVKIINFISFGPLTINLWYQLYVERIIFDGDFGTTEKRDRAKSVVYETSNLATASRGYTITLVRNDPVSNRHDNGTATRPGLNDRVNGRSRCQVPCFKQADHARERAAAVPRACYQMTKHTVPPNRWRMYSDIFVRNDMSNRFVQLSPHRKKMPFHIANVLEIFSDMDFTRVFDSFIFLSTQPWSIRSLLRHLIFVSIVKRKTNQFLSVDGY